MPVKRPQNSSTDAATKKNVDFSRVITLLTKNAHTREQLIIKLLATTGITPHELVNLKQTDLQGLFLNVTHTKNGQPRRIQLTKQLATTLKQHATKEYLFSSRQSTQLTTRRIEQLMQNACKKAGIKTITPRDLRRHYLEQAATQARTKEELKTLTGLKSITKRNTLTKNEEQRLNNTLKKAPLRDKTLITLLKETGINLTEALTLKKKQVHTKLLLRDRTIPLTTTLRQQLNSLAQYPNDHLFSSRQSTQLTARRAEQIITQWGIQARIELTANKLRATAIERTEDAEQAQHNAGLKTPLFYTHGKPTRRGGAP